MTSSGTVDATLDPGVLRALIGIGSALTVETVLDRVVRAALAVVGAQAGAASTATGTGEGTVAVAGVVAPDHSLMEVAAVRESGGRLHGLSRAAAGDEHRRLGSGGDDVVELPIVVQGAARGSLLVWGVAGRPRTEALAALAAAAGVAIGNARLFEQAEQRRRWLEAAAEILGAMLGNSDREAELALVADRAREVGEAEFAMILLPCGPDQLVVEVISVASGGDPRRMRGTRMPLEGTLCGQVVLEGEAVVVDDPTPGADVRPDIEGDAEGDAAGPTLLVPLGRAQDVRGVLALARGAGARNFTTVDVQLVTTFGNQAALALDRARAQSDRAQLAVLEDRDRIARDLHDLVIQRLFATGLALQGLSRRAEPPVKERLDGAVDDLDQTIRDIRTTIFQLNRKPDSDDLRGQIHDVVDEAARPLGFGVGLDLRGPVAEAVPDEVGPHLVAVLRESLSNVAKHARARAVTVTVDVGAEVVLTVEDDGAGFVGDPHGSGVRNMRRRAEMHGGRFEILARPGGGTRLQWRVPCS